MKSKKVLIGLIVAAFVGGFNYVSAQPKANYQNNLIEIGPDNISGRVRSIVVDKADPSNTTIYAGGVAGGLYKKTGDDNWEFVPCVINGKQVTLPISYMIQLPDNSLLIATGEGFEQHHGITSDRMSPKGRGLYRFTPNDGKFQIMPGTDPASDSRWEYINHMDCLERDGNTYVYVTTNGGLFSFVWNTENPNWNAVPALVMAGTFHDVVIISADNIAYVSAPGKLYRIGNVTSQSGMVDVTSSNSAFATASRIELTATTSHTAVGDGYVHKTYLYAVVSDKNGLLQAVYLTNDQQNWTRLTTNTITPFNTTNPGYINSAITIDPQNYQRIIVGGASIWVGEGFVENSYYQWTKSSYSENELNGGNYMGMVYSSPLFVHSGIHQIVPAPEVKNGDTTWVYYIATDGGVYKNSDNFSMMFSSLNKGLNTVQYNHIAVSPDGSLIGGAVSNSCPFIQSRNAHNGTPENVRATWYDGDTASILNHMANVLWIGSGAGVATSMFQALLPYNRRTIFVSSDPGYFMRESSNVSSFGRACDDYADFYNTQTWTTADAFLGTIAISSNKIPQIRLWETNNNTLWRDSITFTLDTLGNYFHNGTETPLHGNTNIVAGDQVIVPSPAQFGYPFRYTFTESFTAKDQMTHRVPNPVVSRAIINGRDVNGLGNVYMTMTPTDFRRVWSASEASVVDKIMNWVPIYKSDYGYSVDNIAFSRDGDAVFVNVINDTTKANFIFRCYNLTSANPNSVKDVSDKLGFIKDDTTTTDINRTSIFDTIKFSDGSLFRRPVTSIVVDTRNNKDDLLITFGGYDTTDTPNMLYVHNYSNRATRTVTPMNVTFAANAMTAADPVYTAMIEYTTGRIFVGTEKGVFYVDNFGSTNWQEYGDFNGVPVTSIVQQTKVLPRERYETHEGVKTELNLFARTKYPYAIYFGTYGRGIFMDTEYVTDMTPEVCDPDDFVGITNVDKGDNHVRIYPNPVSNNANIEISVSNAANAVMKIYDITGKLIYTENMGYLSEGVHNYSINCNKFVHGMYLVNINLGNESATTKLIVR